MKKLIVFIVGIAVAVAAIIFVPRYLNSQNGGSVNTISESKLKEVIEISELQTIEYTYNAVTQVYSENGETLKYYVAYEGGVRAGINLEDVAVSVDDVEKVITITVPNATIQETSINPGTLEYIFMKEKYNTAETSAEANAQCEDDLRNRAGKEGDMLDLARENAVSALEALIAPWVEQVDSKYSVEVK